MLSHYAVVLALASAFFALSILPTRADTASDIKALQASVKTLQSQVGTLQTQNTSLQSQVNTLKSTLRFVTRVTDPARTDGMKGTELYITGMNLHVVNGLGATNGEPSNPTDTTKATVNGLGNVIIGYNALRGNDNSGHSRDVRTGSHNLIVGDSQNYSSYGGLVAGAYNTLAGVYASISGGSSSTASGTDASVSGGFFNTASGYFSSIMGGFGNSATGTGATVTGGLGNTVSGYYAGIVAGTDLQQNSTYGFSAGGSSGSGTFHSP